MHSILLKDIFSHLAMGTYYDFGNIAVIQKDRHHRKVAMRFENCNAI